MQLHQIYDGHKVYAVKSGKENIKHNYKDKLSLSPTKTCTGLLKKQDNKMEPNYWVLGNHS